MGHLGVVIDTVNNTLFLPVAGIARIIQEVLSMIQGQHSPLMQLSRLIGFLILTIESVHWGRFHPRTLQQLLRPYQLHIAQRRDIQLLVPHKVKKDLLWWTWAANLSQGKKYWIPQELQLFTSVSLSG